MSLTKFLLARIADDEAESSQVHERDCDLIRQGAVDPSWGWECSCDRPARVLAECEAKRSIIAMERERIAAIAVPDRIRAVMTNPDGSRIMYALALPYADHPDYREEWRP